MKKLLASLLLAPSLLLASPTPHPPLQRGGATVAEASRPVPTPPADLPPAAVQAYYYLVGIVGIEPCDAVKVVLGYDVSTNAQRYAHARLQELGYDFPTPDPTTAFDCPL